MKKLLVLIVFVGLLIMSSPEEIVPRADWLPNTALPKALESEASGILGATETILDTSLVTTSQKVNISVQSLVLGTSSNPSIGSIQTDILNPSLILDSDQTYNSLQGTGYAVRFKPHKTARIDSILLPAFANWKNDSWKSVSMTLSTNLTSGNILFSVSFQRQTLTTESNNMLLLPISSKLGGPGSVQINSSETLFLKFEFAGNVVDVLAKVSEDRTGFDENQVYVLENGTWNEKTGFDFNAVFLESKESYVSVPQKTQLNISTTTGLSVIQSIYSDDSGGSFYDPSIGWKLLIYDSNALNLNIDPNPIGRGLESNVSVQLSTNNGLIANQSALTFLLDWETRRIIVAGMFLTNSSGMFDFQFNPSRTGNYAISTASANITGLANISVVEPSITVSNWSQRGIYGSGKSWNETKVSISLRAQWNPGGQETINGTVRVFLNQSLVLEGRTNNTGWFDGVFYTSLPAGNYDSILGIEILANSISAVWTYNLSISEGEFNPVLLNPSSPFSANRSLIFVVANSFGNLINGANISAMLENQSSFNITDWQGQTTLEFENIPPGTYDLLVEVRMPSYKAFQSAYQVNVTTAGILVEPDIWEIRPYYGDSYVISGRITDSSGMPVPNADVQFIAKLTYKDVILSPQQQFQTDATGRFSASLWDNFSETSFLLSINILGVNDTDTAYALVSVNKQPIPTHISLEVKNSTFPNMPFARGRLVDEYGTPLSGRELKVTIDTNEYFITTNETGWFEFSFPNLSAGDYVVNVSYIPLSTAKEQISYNQTTARIARGILQISLQSSFYEGVAGRELAISGKILSNASLVPNHLVFLRNESDSEVARTYTNDLGEFSLTILLTGGLGIQNFTIFASSTINYQGDSQSITVKITRLVPLITPLFPSNVVFSPILQLQFLVTDQANVPLENTTLQLRINNMTYSSNTMTNGIAEFSLGLLPGIYSFTATINETTSIIGSNLSSSITIDPLNIEVNVVQENLVSGYPGLIEFQLLYENGTPYSDSLTVTINGTDYLLVSNSSGWARLSITLMEGNYSLTIKDSWNSNFSIYPEYITVEKETILISANVPPDIAIDELMEFNITLQTNAGLILANVTIRIEVTDGSTVLFSITTRTNTAGLARVSFGFPENTTAFVEQQLVLKIIVMSTELTSEQTSLFNFRSGQIFGNVSVVSQSVAQEIVAEIGATNRNGDLISFKASGYLDGTLIFTSNVVNSTEILFSLFEKGNYTLVVIFEKEGYLTTSISVEFEVQGLEVSIQVIDYLAQYLNNQSFLDVELRLVNGSPAINISVQLWISNDLFQTMVSDSMGRIRFELPNDRWGTYSITLVHLGSPITSTAILDTTIFFERARLSFVLTPGYANETPVIWIDLLINGQNIKLNESIELYWKDSQATLWQFFSFQPGITSAIDYGPSVEIDLRIDDTNRFVGVSLRYAIPPVSSLEISLISQPIVLSNVELLISSGGKELTNTRVAVTIQGNDTISVLELKTDSQGVVRIDWSNFSNYSVANISATLVINNTVVSPILTISFGQRPWIVTLSFNAHGADGLWLQMTDLNSQTWLSTDFTVSIIVNGSLSKTVTNQTTIFIERERLPPSEFLEISIILEDALKIYSDSIVRFSVQQPLSVFLNLSDQIAEKGDNLTLFLDPSVSYWNESVYNIELIATVNGEVIGASTLEAVIQNGLKLMIDKLSLGNHLVNVSGYLSGNEKVFSYVFNLEIVKEKIEAFVLFDNHGYGHNITIKIRIADNDNSTVTDGSVKVMVAFEGKLITSTRFLLSEVRDQWNLITLPHYLTNGSLTVNIIYEPFFFSSYEEASFEIAYTITPEIPNLSIVSGEARYGEDWEITVIAMGEFNQSLPFTTLELVEYNITITTDEKGIAILPAIELEPGNYSIYILASYQNYDGKVGFYFFLPVEKRIIPLRYDSVVSVSFGETLVLALPYLPEGKSNYTVAIYDEGSQIYIDMTQSGIFEFNTLLLSKIGTFVLIIERSETDLTEAATIKITLNVEKASTIIAVTDSWFNGTSIVLRGTLQTTVGTKLSGEKLILRLYQDDQMLSEFFIVTDNGFWQFEVPLDPSDKVVTVNLVYDGSEQFEGTSLIALQFIPNDFLEAENGELGFSRVSSISDETLVTSLAILLVPAMGFGLEQMLRRVKNK